LLPPSRQRKQSAKSPPLVIEMDLPAAIRHAGFFIAEPMAAELIVQNLEQSIRPIAIYPHAAGIYSAP